MPILINQWRIREVRLLFLGIFIAVLALTSVQFFVSRVSQAMLRQAAQVLGGDLVITSPQPLNPDYLQFAQTNGLRTAEMVQFTSMVVAGEALHLAQVQAVSATYPLLGEIQISADMTSPAQPANQVPVTGEIWAEARLLSSLGIQPGAAVQLGQRHFRLTQVISKTPDQNLNAFQFAPRVLMPLSELATTGLLVPASRAQFNYLFAGNAAAIQLFRLWLEPRLKKSERIRGIDDNIQSIQQTLTRGQRFLAMAALLTALLAGAALALTSYRFVQHESRSVAILKTLGAGKRRLIRHYGGLLLALTTTAGLVGSGGGYLLQGVGAHLAQSVLNLDLPPAEWQPALTGLLTAWLMGLGFVLPYLLSLLQVVPMHLLQQDLQQDSPSFRQFPWHQRLGMLLIALGGFGLLIELQLHHPLTSGLFLLALAGMMGVIGLIIAGLLRLAQGLARMLGIYTVYLAHLARRSLLLLMVFSVGLFSLLLLSTLRNELLGQWQASIPADAPDHFLVNIQPVELPILQAWLQQRQMMALFYPLVRGRLTHINRQAVIPDEKDNNPRVQQLLNRTFNLSATAVLPPDNQITAGAWFAAGDQAKGLSVETSIMENLGLKLGDELTFDIGGQAVTEAIISVRRVRWDNLQPNFFVLLAPALLSHYPQTYITSIFVGEKTGLIREMIQQFPALTVIDSRNIVVQVRDMMTKASQAVQIIFLFALAAGVVVLLAVIQAQQNTRRQEIALLKTLGASRAQLRRMILTEFSLLGAVAGFLAGALSVVASNLIAYHWLELPWVFNAMPMVIGMVGGGILVGITGYWNLRPLLVIPPVTLLAQAN